MVHSKSSEILVNNSGTHPAITNGPILILVTLDITHDLNIIHLCKVFLRLPAHPQIPATPAVPHVQTEEGMRWWKLHRV